MSERNEDWLGNGAKVATILSFAMAFGASRNDRQEPQFQERSAEVAEASRLDQHEVTLGLKRLAYELIGRAESPLAIPITNVGKSKALRVEAKWEAHEIELPNGKTRKVKWESKDYVSSLNMEGNSEASITHTPSLLKTDGEVRTQKIRGVLTLSCIDGLGRPRDVQYEFTMEAICEDSGARKLTFHFAPSGYDGSFSLMG